MQIHTHAYMYIYIYICIHMHIGIACAILSFKFDDDLRTPALRLPTASTLEIDKIDQTVCPPIAWTRSKTELAPCRKTSLQITCNAGLQSCADAIPLASKATGHNNDEHCDPVFLV